jgi:outer membrane receptor protein involved in Fe transport
LDLHWGIDWIGKTQSYDLKEVDPDTDPFFLETPNYYLHNASVRYHVGKFGITLGVRNLFDKDPPKISSGVIPRIGNAPLYSGYDYVGRTFFLNVTAGIDELLR